jgi:hypothetical protein
VDLQRHVAGRSGEFLLFAVTPPRLTTSPEEAAEIGRVTLQRLRSLAIDGLVVYDIDDESDRNSDERPFPFLPTMDPADYLARDLVGLEVPAIVYRAVGKYREDRFRSWLEEQDPSRSLAVFVGPSSREKAVLTSVARAYELRDEVQPELPLGAAKDLVSDYHHECAAQNLAPVPIVLSFSAGGPVRAQRRERLDPKGRDRCLRTARRPAGSRAASLTRPRPGAPPAGGRVG